MRASQICLRFDEHNDLKQAWAKMSEVERTRIAQLYARLLVKAAKVDPHGPRQQKERTS